MPTLLRSRAGVVALLPAALLSGGSSRAFSRRRPEWWWRRKPAACEPARNSPCRSPIDGIVVALGCGSVSWGLRP